MVSITTHQDTSAIPPMTSPVIDLMTSPVIDLMSRPDSPNVHRPLPTTATATTTTTITTLPLPPQPQQDANQALEERLDKHGSRLYRLENQDIPNQVRKAVDEIVTNAVDWAMQAPLRERFRDLPEADMKEILHNRMWESKSYQTHEDHMMLYEALENTAASSSSKTAVSAEYTTWTTTDTRIKPSVSPIPKELHMDDDTTANEQAYSFSGEDVGRDHIPTVNLRQSWWKPLTKDRPATPEPAWSIPSSALTIPANN
ncbi:hypothetical protein Tco_1206982 [Tanacetum coccineum]